VHPGVDPQNRLRRFAASAASMVSLTFRDMGTSLTTGFSLKHQQAANRVELTRER
jgi:hypothetical protein